MSSQKYWPYGATRSGGVTQTDKLYTGQQEEPGDAALGLYNYKARFYSTTLGRFVSADPMAGDATSMGLNRLSYANNNPLRFTDPSGFASQEDIENCAAHLSDCLAWSFGISDVGLIIVGGQGQEGDSIDASFSYLVKRFLALTSNCAARVDACYAALTDAIVREGGYDAVYHAFGLRFIKTEVADWAAVVGGPETSPERKLGKALTTETEGKFILGVVGFSEGANVVLEYFRHHSRTNVAFYLIEPAGFAVSEEVCAGGVRQCAGIIQLQLQSAVRFDRTFPYIHFDGTLGLTHSPHNDPETAKTMMSALVEVTVDLRKGIR